MLNRIRHHPLRKSLWLIVLFGSLLTQTQTLFACELLDNGTQTKCCCDEDMDKGCPMGGGCDTSTDGMLTGCCHVSTQVDVGLQDVAVADTAHSKLVISLDAAQPPPAIITATTLLFPVSSSLVRAPLAPALPLLGTHTYLATNRFRI